MMLRENTSERDRCSLVPSGKGTLYAFSCQVMSGQDCIATCDSKSSSLMESSLHELEERPKPEYIPITMRNDDQTRTQDGRLPPAVF